MYRTRNKSNIEEFDGRYTGCYLCGRCSKGDLQSYTYVYSDDRKMVKCGRELIELLPVSDNNIAEIEQQ